MYNTSIYWVVNAIKTIYGTIKVAIDHSIARVKNWVGSCGELKKRSTVSVHLRCIFLAFPKTLVFFCIFFPTFLTFVLKVWFGMYNSPSQYLTQSISKSNRYQSRLALLCEPLQSPSFNRVEVFSWVKELRFYSSSILLNS